jgi:hypothetical protein
MSEYYDFKTLSSEDFERLARDLLSAEWETRIESFKSGRDKGVDLRYAAPDSNEKIIIQCKHYAPDAFVRLKRVLQNDELPKVRKLSPERYLVVTSIPLSVANKDELFELLHPWCNSTNDILGASEINSLLVSHPNILRAHFSAAAFDFDDTYLDGEFMSVISDAAQSQPDEDDLDERVNTPRIDESIDIDGLFAELLNRN